MFKCYKQSWGNQKLRVKEQPFAHVLQNRGVGKNLAMFTGKQLCWNLFSIKLQVLRHEILLKIYCKEGGFSENITKLLRTGFFHRASPVNAFEGLCHKQRHFLQTKEKTGTVLSCNF